MFVSVNSGRMRTVRSALDPTGRNRMIKVISGSNWHLCGQSL